MDSRIYSLQYPIDANDLIRNKKSIRKRLLEQKKTKIHKKIAILGGSTTSLIKDMLEIFLLNYGIEAEFYQSEYGKYWEDAMFDNPELEAFSPDIFYIHTTVRNIKTFPALGETEEAVDSHIKQAYRSFEDMWLKLFEKYKGIIIQNNFQKPIYRLLGNKDASDIHGKISFVDRLNQRFYEFAGKNSNFYINDIDWLSSCFGLYAWSDPSYWYMYKCDPAFPAIPELAFNLANIIKSILGMNKKALALDLDNTLWGGVVGDDGPEGIEIGKETPRGELYSEFQSYIKEQKDLGIMLSVVSKNEEENALAGLKREDSVLSPEDFLVIKANWLPKDQNLVEVAREINIGEDAIVFVDDNPAEREIARSQIPGLGVPEMDLPERYIINLDRNGFFEATSISADDMKRNEMYRANLEREKSQARFDSYSDYLRSLEMKAEISAFRPMYMDRIAQLTNKSNQFNLTTRRYTRADIENMAGDSDYVTLYGKLIDKFGDNGVVAITIGKRRNPEEMDIILWLMSCRVLKRDMEHAMMDRFVEECEAIGIKRIYGHYYPTPKNKMVKDFYGDMGFQLIGESEEGNRLWLLDISGGYEKKNSIIQV